MMRSIPVITMPLRVAETSNKQKGYALLEILLALAIAVIIIVAMVSLGVSTVRAVSSNRYYAEAGRIAQRETDRLKLLRDSNIWSGSGSFTEKISNGDCVNTLTEIKKCYLTISGSPSVLSVNSGENTINIGNISTNLPVTYSFSINELLSSPNKASYTVRVLWIIGGVSKSYKIEGILTDWREQ